jgi:hypothetical protein
LVTHDTELITCIAVAASSDACLVTLDAAEVCVAELASIDAVTATQVIISASCVAQRKIGTVQDCYDNSTTLRHYYSKYADTSYSKHICWQSLQILSRRCEKFKKKLSKKEEKRVRIAVCVNLTVVVFTY